MTHRTGIFIVVKNAGLLIIERQKKMPTGIYRRITKIATCHPNRKHYGRGYCRSCYDKYFYYNIRCEQRKGKRYKEGLKHRYGITIADYDSMYSKQKGVCAICAKPPKTKRLNVDHDHITNRVRGLLCPKCNASLGFFELYANKAHEYLSRAEPV